MKFEIEQEVSVFVERSRAAVEIHSVVDVSERFVYTVGSGRSRFGHCGRGAAKWCKWNADGTAADGHGAYIKPTADVDHLCVTRCQLETCQDAASDLTKVIGDCAVLAEKIKSMESK